MPTTQNFSKWDIDRFLNRIIPANRLDRLPTWFSRWFGHRSKDNPQKPISEPLVWFWAFIGAFCGIALLEGMFNESSLFEEKHVPLIIGSFGASAILLYNTIESPLAQPRNVLGGNLLASIIGVGITKLFLLQNPDNFEDLRWLTGALCVATASAVMGITKTVHPPAGATALLSAVDANSRRLGWYYVAVIVLSSILVICVALITNNIQRRYPAYWWTPVSLAKNKLPRHDIEEVKKHVSPEIRVDVKEANEIESMGRDQVVLITKNGVTVPEDFALGDEERQMLEELSDRLEEFLGKSEGLGNGKDRPAGISERSSGTSTLGDRQTSG